jgi:hypothetical protein
MKMHEGQTAKTTAARTTKRRAHGEGSIVQRGDGSWQFSLRLGRDHGTGQHRRLVLYARTRAELLRKVTDERARGGGTLRAPQPGTLADYLTAWLRDDVEPNRAANTHALYNRVVEKRLTPTRSSGSMRGYGRTARARRSFTAPV